MFASKILNVSVLTASLLSAIGGQPALCRSPQAEAHAGAAIPKSAKNDEAAVKAQLSALKACVLNGNAKAMANLWTEDGRYIDDQGNAFQGRASLEKNFGDVFQQDGKRQVEIVAETLRMPSGNVALIDGIVKCKEGGEVVPATRYSMVLVKQKGDWLISSATETPILSTATLNPLQPLDWLIGDWSAVRDGATVTMKAEWVPSKNFIQCRYDIKKPNEPDRTEMQIIGWDPREQRPVSWTFDSSGGWGQGKWSRGHEQWVVDASGVERDGSVTTSTNIYSDTDANDFSWQSVNRRLDGISVGDTVPLKVQRVAK